MALSKAMLKGMGLTEEQISAIIEGHMDSVTALQDEVKAEKERADGLQKDLDTSKKDGWKEKYEKEHDDFEKYKQEIDTQKAYQAKELAYKGQLKALGISDKIADLVVKASGKDIESIELDKDGQIKEVEKLVDVLKTSYADYITDEQVEGEKVPKPPAGDKGAAFEALSLNEKMAYANEHPGAPEVTAWLGK